MNLKSLISSTIVFAILISASIFSVAHANEQVIATVTSDENRAIFKLVIDSLDGRTITTFYKDYYIDGQKVYRDTFSPEGLLMKKGMILEQREKYIIMKLKSNNFDLEQGGVVVVDTLYNAISGERKSYEIQLAQGNSGWTLFKHGKSIKDITIKTNRVMLIGAVGIKNLVMK